MDKGSKSEKIPNIWHLSIQYGLLCVNIAKKTHFMHLENGKTFFNQKLETLFGALLAW
jgi:hypothetical protein